MILYELTEEGEVAAESAAGMTYTRRPGEPASEEADALRVVFLDYYADIEHGPYPPVSKPAIARRLRRGGFTNPTKFITTWKDLGWISFRELTDRRKIVETKRIAR